MTAGALLLAAALGLPPNAPAPAGEPTPLGAAASSMPGPLAEVGFDQRLGEGLPLDLGFTDEEGRRVELGSYFGTRPVVLAPVYYDCPMLCTMTLSGLASSLKVLPFAAGREFEVVVFSIDPGETPAEAAARKRSTLERYGRPEAAGGLHFLTGDAGAVARLAEAIGFRYTRDEASGEFAHVAGVVLATPEGQIARYFFGIEYPARELRLSLVEAAEGRIGSLVDQLLLYCYRYDPAAGRYSAVAMNVVRLGGAATVAALTLLVGGFLYRERVRKASLGTA